jgi:hypothetical protein
MRISLNHSMVVIAFVQVPWILIAWPTKLTNPTHVPIEFYITGSISWAGGFTAGPIMCCLINAPRMLNPPTRSPLASRSCFARARKIHMWSEICPDLLQ